MLELKAIDATVQRGMQAQATSHKTEIGEQVETQAVRAAVGGIWRKETSHAL